jgi:hypothetical protein
VQNEMESSTQNSELSNGEEKMIVATTMCLHNFIRENNVEDKDFSRNPDYVPTIQMIVATTMCLYNFIRENNVGDKYFSKNPDYVPTIPSRNRNHIPSQNASDKSTSQSDTRCCANNCGSQ